MTSHYTEHDPELVYLIALTLIEGVGPASVRQLLHDSTPEQLLYSTQYVQESIDGEIQSKTTIAKIRNAKPDVLLEKAYKQIELSQHYGVKIVKYNDICYPANLKESFTSPLVLYVRGKLKKEDKRSVAVVGSREASLEGRKRAAKLAGLLAEKDVVVVSGLAKGIDTAAHEGALDAGCRTIAVVGTGLDQTYPRENTRLADEIASNGAVISQFPFGSPPAGRHFPLRNRTMAYLSVGTIVVEAGPTSGAKMQADFALKSDNPKRWVFLLRSLIEAQDKNGWAHEFIARGAEAVADVENVVTKLFPSEPEAPQDLVQKTLF